MCVTCCEIVCEMLCRRVVCGVEEEVCDML